MRIRRFVTLLAGLALLASCSSDGGDQGSPDDPAADGAEASGEPTFPMPEGAWLLMVSYEHETSRNDWYFYVSFVPETGDTVVSPLSRTDDDDDWGADPLMVSADYQWSLRNLEASPGERESGIISIYRLADGSERSVDLREMTGDVRFEPVGVCFDGADPDTLHAVDAEGAVWTVDLAAETATETGTVIEDFYGRPGDEDSSWQFARDGSGDIVMREGDEEDFVDDSQLGGMAVLSYEDEDELPDLPADRDYKVRTDDGTVWAFSLEGNEPKHARAYRIPAGAGDWERLEASPVLFPAAPEDINDGYEDVEFVRPPR